MKTIALLTGILRRPGQSCAALSGALALIVLLSWSFGSWKVTTLGHDRVPMAPSTALSLLLLSCGVVVHSRWPSRGFTRVFTHLVALGVVALGLLVLSNTAFSWGARLEAWLASTADQVGNVPVGRMSPLTATALLLSALALWLEGPHLGRRWPYRQAASLLALAASSIGIVVLLSYMADAPLLYDTDTVPMAFSTALALVLLGVGLLTGGGADTFPLSLLETVSNAASAAPRRWVTGYLITFCFLSAGIGTVGYCYFKHQIATSRKAAANELSAVVDLKVQQILEWRKERLGNAEHIMLDPFVGQHGEEFLAGPAQGRQRSSLLAWLRLIQERNQGLRTVLLDPQMNVRLAFPEDKVYFGPIAQAFASTAIRSAQVVFSDLHHSRFSGDVHLDVAIPIIAGRASPEAGGPLSESARSPAIAVIVVEVDPHKFLYPHIQSWPTPSPTAETLLVRREGNEVVFLNELRHAQGKAMSRRLPIDRKGLPAAEAALGHEGTVEGVDYRNVPVLACTRTIPGTPWFIVAKVDQTEIYAPLRERGLTTAAIAMVLVVLAALCIGQLVRRHDNQWLQSQLAMERESRLILDSLDEGVLGLDWQGRHVFVNPAACRLLGYEPEELIGKCSHAIWHSKKADGSRHPPEECRIHAALRTGKSCRSDQEVFWRKDGTSFPVEYVATPSLEKDRPVALALCFRDVSERRHADEERMKLLVRLQGINELQQWLLTPAPLNDKLRRITEDIVRLFSADFCRIWLLRPGDLCEGDCIHAEANEGPHVCRYRDRCLHLLASSGRYTHIDGQGHRRVPFGCYKIGLVASGEDHRFLTNDAQNDPRVHDHQWARELGLESFAGYQLQVPGGETLGVLALFAKAPIAADEDAMIDGLSSTIALVVQQAAAEKESRRSEQRHRVLFEGSRDALMTLSPTTGRFASGNPAAVQMFRAKDEAEFISLGPWNVSPEMQPDGRGSADKAQEMIETAIREGSQFFEWTHQRLSGEPFPATVLLTRVELDGQVVLQATVRDITAEKQAEDERALTVQRMESLLALSQMSDPSPDAFIAKVIEDAIRLTRSEIGYLAVLNEDESIMTMQYWSRSAHASCKMVDKPIVYPVEKTGLWGEAVRQRKPVVTNDYSAPNPHKRGTPEGHVPVKRHMNIPVFHGQRIVAVAGVGNKRTDYDESDVRQLQLLMEGWWQIVMRTRAEEGLRTYATALEATNRALEESNRRAEAATQAKTQFLANMSHEIRTPMTAILGFTDMLLEDLKEPRSVETGQIIKRNGEHLLQLINDILDISKIEAGKVEVEQIPWSPRNVVADVVSLMHVRAAAKGLTLSEDYLGAIPETITTDPARLRQILVNLVGNAIKFTDAGGVRIVTRLVRDAGDKSLLRFDVIDTGIGIPEAAIGRLFQPFTQVDASTSRKYEGTGLGLSISRQLARALGGDTTASSELGKGSTFSVTVATGSLEGVRLVEYLKEGWSDNRQLDPSTAPSSQGLACRVLLADDIPDNQRLIGALLLAAGAAVTIAGDGEEAVKMALAARPGSGKAGDDRTQPFDVVLMDIQMPVLDGYQATRRLRQEGYTAPIIALTAHTMRGDREKSLAAGCDDYLPKPVDQKQLVETVAKWAASRHEQTPAAVGNEILSEPAGQAI